MEAGPPLPSARRGRGQAQAQLAGALPLLLGIVVACALWAVTQKFLEVEKSLPIMRHAALLVSMW
jgi:hypothetical protein